MSLEIIPRQQGPLLTVPAIIADAGDGDTGPRPLASPSGFATTPSGPPALPPISKAAAPSSTPSKSLTTKAPKPPSSMTAPAIRLRSMKSSGL